MRYSSGIVIAFATVALSATVRAQETLHLAKLQTSALRHDPRGRQLGLLETQAARRLENLATERLPQLSLTSEATHQSDVTSIGIVTPSGTPPQPPKDRWQALVNVQQLLYDGGSIAGRRAVERARLEESREAVHAAQYRLRAEVDSYFFTAFLLQERDRELAALDEDLGARLEVLRARVREGAALPGEVAALEAERLRTRQSVAEVRAGRRGALATLAVLAGERVTELQVLALPDLANVGRAGHAADTGIVRARPEFAQFARTRARIGSEVALADVETRPRVYAFAQMGYGRPGLDQFNRKPDEFWIAGVRMEWRFWNWGTVGRQRDVLRLQERIVAVEEDAFASALERGIQTDLEQIARLDSSFATDERIVELREQVERQASAQLNEGAITAADYVEARTDLLEARLGLQRHRVELAQARARYLTTLGLTSPGAETRP
ncbi:MAG: TolC family protein [Gemmatimonadota bacterium]|nr:TolC family protein [Gemmatimonadota bacterium]